MECTHGGFLPLSISAADPAGHSDRLYMCIDRMYTYPQDEAPQLKVMSFASCMNKDGKSKKEGLLCVRETVGYATCDRYKHKPKNDRMSFFFFLSLA